MYRGEMEVWLMLMLLSMSSKLLKEARLKELFLQLRVTPNLKSWKNPSWQTRDGSHDALLPHRQESRALRSALQGEVRVRCLVRGSGGSHWPPD